MSILVSLREFSYSVPPAIDSLLPEVGACVSLSLVKVFYQLVKGCALQVSDESSVNGLYRGVCEKLTYFIMIEGWKTFINRTKVDLSNGEEQFSPDVYRDVECDILFFVALRHLLGTPNSLPHCSSPLALQ